MIKFIKSQYRKFFPRKKLTKEEIEAGWNKATEQANAFGKALWRLQEQYPDGL